jgi:hypothetical protein
MNSELIDFFKEERGRTFLPEPQFAERVMARLASERTVLAGGITAESVLAGVRPVLMMALALLFVALAIQIMIPVEPARGAIEAYMSQDLTLNERVLIAGSPTLPTPAQLEELLLLEGGK